MCMLMETSQQNLRNSLHTVITVQWQTECDGLEAQAYSQKTEQEGIDARRLFDPIPMGLSTHALTFHSSLSVFCVKLLYILVFSLPLIFIKCYTQMDILPLLKQ